MMLRLVVNFLEASLKLLVTRDHQISTYRDSLGLMGKPVPSHLYSASFASNHRYYDPYLHTAVW